MKRDRDGEPLADEDEPVSRRDCIAGWLGEDDDGRPVPCPLGRPQGRHRGRPAGTAPLHDVEAALRASPTRPLARSTRGAGRLLESLLTAKRAS